MPKTKYEHPVCAIRTAMFNMHISIKFIIKISIIFKYVIFHANIQSSNMYKTNLGVDLISI
jgi:hypothetical protein